MRFFQFACVSFLLMGSGAAADHSEYKTPGQDTWDVSKFEDRFTAGPVLAKLTTAGITRAVCIIYVGAKSGDFGVMSVLDVGPAASCSGEVADYLSLTDEDEVRRGLSGHKAVDTGDSEFADKEAALWWFPIRPSAIYFRVTDPKTGKERWDAVCVGLMRLYDDRKVEHRSIVYPRENSHETITGFRTPEVKCGGIKFAVRNEIKTEKPKFLGSREELEKLTQNKARTTGSGQARPNH